MDFTKINVEIVKNWIKYLHFYKKYVTIPKYYRKTVRRNNKMEVIKWILIVIYLIIALALIILTLIQSKEDAGLSSTITGSSTNNFFEKNKGRTKEGKQKRWTVILSVVFAILTIVLGILYMA